MIQICKDNQAKGRQVQAYTVQQVIRGNIAIDGIAGRSPAHAAPYTHKDHLLYTVKKYKLNLSNIYITIYETE